MRITLSQLLIAIILTGVSYATDSSAQGILDNSVKLEKTSSTLLDVLKTIEKVAAVKFVYSKNLVDVNQEVYLSANNEKLSDVLDLILKTRGINYEAYENQIVLSKLKTENAVIKSVADIVVTGTVTSTKGETLPGVSVKIKGTATGTSTNVSGTYSIKVPTTQTNGTLVFTFVGFSTQEVPINGRTVINVKLEENVKSLNEVVVVGYGTQRRGNVAQAVASVDMNKVKEVPVTNVSQALQGRVAGVVSVPSSFRPGSGSTIKLRGSRSLSATNDPLYVVDGVPITYSIDDINPLDIESIDVLKDASATAIYGSRGANGVIQITTKKGKSGKVSVEYSGNTSAESIVRKLEVYNGSEFAQFRRDAYIGSGQYNPTANANNPSKKYFPDPESDYTIFGSNDNRLWNNIKNAYEFVELDVTSTVKKFVAKTRPTTAEEKALLASLGYPVLNEVAIYDPSKITTFDWGNEALRTGITNSHNFSVSGGSEKLRSSLSGGYFSQNGIIKSQDYTRYTLSNNNTLYVTPSVQFGTNINYTNSVQNVGTDLYGAALGQFPLVEPYDENGNFLLNPGADDQVFNPLNDVNTVLSRLKTNRLLSNVYGQIGFLKSFTLKSTLGIDFSGQRDGRFNGSRSSVQRLADPNGSEILNNNFTWTVQNQLNFNRSFGKKHELGVTLVNELLRENKEQVSLTSNSLTYESQLWYALQNNATGTIISNSTTPYSQRSLYSYLGRVNYIFNSKYILTAALRHDVSSVLAPGNKAASFPSVSVAWKVDQENFMKSLSFVEQLKLRIGYGEVGNAGIDPYKTSGPLAGPTYYNFGDAIAISYSPNLLPSPNLTWERTKTKNLGIDYGFYKGRLSGSIDLYESNTNNIQNIQVPGALGYTGGAFVNLGNVRNRGVEVAVSGVIIDKSRKNDGFKWTADISFARNKEEVTYLNERGENVIAQQWFYGQPVRTYWDYKNQGIFQYTDTLSGGILKDYWWKKGNNRNSDLFKPGRIRVEDMNGDTTITEADKIFIGSPNPKWTAGINNAVSFKRFSLSTFVYISKGSTVRDFRPGLVGRYPGPKVNYWTPTNPSNDYQQPNRTSDIPSYWQSLSFRDGSFVRVRNIQLAYNVPVATVKRLGINNLAVSVSAVNPFIFSKFKRYDPETVPYSSTYPSSSTNSPSPTSYSYRSFVLGVRCGL
ncbi:TonB-dependent receptor [Desertivirga arenae]|uniref:TonB-dependent receptor n=1 Tax=Desertivirga arenae TaxID=2810309 RepID=UPI001A957549|nr:TonB-dependent receptor [Pedobacter sp. SYSU D00823]